MVAATIAVRNGDVAAAEWSIFCRGAPIAKDKPSPLPVGLGVSEKTWKNICSVATGLPAFAAAVASFKECPKEWEAWINSAEPFLAEKPKQFKQELTHFQKLLMVRLLREEKTLYAMTYYVENTLGKKFAYSAAAVMEEVSL